MGSAAETAIRSAVGKGIGLLAEFNRKRLDPSAEPHPYLTGIHTPMTEEKTLTDLPVTGVIPKALEGRYLRIGPNPVQPDAQGYHWFVGDGMVHGLSLKDGKALWYRNRWIRSNPVAKALGETAAPGPRHGFGDTVNTNVLGIGGRTWALVEAGSYPVELNETLDGQAYSAFDDTLKGSFSAHPHRDPVSGESHAICYEGPETERVRHIVVSADGKVVREEPIAVKDGPSIHDCAITQAYVVVLDLPVTFSMKRLIGGQRFPYGWNPAHQARVGLLPKTASGDAVIWCDVDPAYVFHVANAFDVADGKVVLDVVAYDSMFADGAKGPDAVGRFERWTVDPVAKTVSRRVLDASPQEFPRVDERRFSLPYRYAYSLAIPTTSEEDRFAGETRLYKHDLQTGLRQTHDFGPGRQPGEFVFVPASADAAEDEGWMIGLVIDTVAETTDLVILDAQAFEGPPTASVRIPHRVPPGFHGNWVAA